MENIELRKCFPVMNGGDGVILSKRGDITVGWELELPPAFRCNEEKYDSLVATLRSAVTLLPDWSIVHKQDVFMRKRYSKEEQCDFLSQSYERHFDGRSYLDHRCRIFVTFSNKKAIHGGSSGLLGLTETGLPKPEAIGRCLGAADQFEAIIRSNELLALHRLSDEEIFGTESIPGIVQDYLNFTDEGADELSDLQLSNDRIRTGDKFISCHLISDLDQLPGEIASCRRVAALSTENSAVNLSYFNEIGQALDCEHIVNQFILKEPLKDIHGELDSKRKRMTSMSTKSAENRVYAEEIQEYLEEAATKQMYTVRAHINVMAAGTEASIDAVKDKVTSAISKMGLTPVHDIHDVPVQFWASIPGNEAGLNYHEYMTLELSGALCMWLYDGFDKGISNGVLKMSDRQRLVPQRFDIQEKAMDEGLIENFNVFLLGPSGSGKSFFMNKYLHSCYEAAQQCFLIDVGDSYRALCHIIQEESGGRDGAYYSFEKGKPISFNPFRNVKRFSSGDGEALDFLFTLMCVLWKNGEESIPASSMKYIKDSVTGFLASWKKKTDPVFNDYFKYVQGTFKKKLKEEKVEKEYFDIESYLISLEQFAGEGTYGYLLNSSESIDILNNRFVVFEIDHIKGDKVIYPITTLVIMDAFMEKMSSNSDFKVMVIEEAWKAIMGTQMANYMLELWKTARKHRTSAVVVTQELKDITSSPIIKDTIVENSAVKILLDQTKYINKFEVLAEQLSMTEDDKAMVLSLNRYHVEGASGREVFFNLGNKKSFVMRLEVSPEECTAFSSKKQDKERLATEIEKTGGNYIEAIKNIVGYGKR